MLPHSRPIGAAALLLGCCGPVAIVYAQSAASEQPTSATPAAQVQDASIQSLKGMSLQQLGSVMVTSVSRSAQPLSDAPAAIYVISHDDILRSGATTLPEMLRLAPNLQVAQISATSYAITARGFNLYDSNKLLVLIDGRSVYTPYFSGVFWDQQDVLPQNIDRIEVISGPGATLWGANAVNGVINIITRKSNLTQGGAVQPAVGNVERSGNAQYGGSIGDQVTYRVYGDTFARDSDQTDTGADARDGWQRTQMGLRSDWNGQNDLVTLQGSAYDGSEEQYGERNQDILGHNVLGRWSHASGAGQSLQLQAYYEYSARLVPGAGADMLGIYDLDVQDSYLWGRTQQFVWGGGYRAEQDQFINNYLTVPALYFDPASQRLERYNVFAQDSIALAPALELVVGVKGEKDAYVSMVPLPSIRLSWQFADSHMLWAAISQAVRAPSREDRDLFEAYLVSPTPIYVLVGNDMQSERLTAYELGYRSEPLPGLSFSVSGFYNVYDDLRSVGETPVTVLPIYYTNGMEGMTYGVEFWGSYQPLSWWRLSGGFNELREDLTFMPGASTIAGIDSAGDDPSHQVSLRSSMDLPLNLSWDAQLRWIGRLPDPAVPAYDELNSHLAWAARPDLTVSLTGNNLLHARHVEFVFQPLTIEIPRTIMLDARLTF